MAVRKQRATTSKEIMEKDINAAIKKGKTRFRYEKLFYILDYKTVYFASGSADRDKETGLEVYSQKWKFAVKKGKWEQV